MTVKSQLLLSYLPEGWAHLGSSLYEDYTADISQVAPQFYSASLSPRDRTLIWNVKLL